MLVVDDEAAIVLLLQEVLAQYHYVPLAATGWAEALEHLQNDSPDLILLDLAMPHVGGSSLLDFIRKHGYDTPVVVISAHISDKAEGHLKTLGVSALIRKPFEVSDVLNEVRRAIGPGRGPEESSVEAGARSLKESQEWTSPGAETASESIQGDRSLPIESEDAKSHEELIEPETKRTRRRRRGRERRWVKTARRRLLVHMGGIILAASLVVATLLGVAHYYAASAGDVETRVRAPGMR